jgi:hypothetical protein
MIPSRMTSAPVAPSAPLTPLITTPPPSRKLSFAQKLAINAFLGIVLALLLAAPTAIAEGPWWHATSGSRPGHLKGGLARNEVKTLVVAQSTGSYFLEEPESIEEQGAIENVNYVELPFSASVAEIQAGLELIYGAGNVEVAESATKEFTITFKGERGFRPVKLSGEGLITISELSASRPDGEIYLTVENLGNQTVGERSLSGPEAVRVSDVLPPGLKAVGIAGTRPEGGAILERVPLVCTLSSLSCALSEPDNEKEGGGDPSRETLAPYDQLEVRIAVVVEGASSGANSVSVSGGEGFLCNQVEEGTGSYKDSGCAGKPAAGNFERVPTGPVAPVSLSRALNFSPEPTPFGVENYELSSEEVGGSVLTQAGAHPFQLTTTIALNQGADKRPLENPSHKPSVNPVALAKDLHFNWPPGLIGNPSAFPQCTDAQFYKGTENGAANACPPQSAVGVATVTVNEPSTAEVADLTVPLFNMVPRVGEPARFGFNVVQANAPVVIDTAVRSGGDYGVTVSSDNITQTAAFLSSQVTVWGVPGDPRHNRQRGWSCLLEAHGRQVEAPLAPCSATETHPEQQPPAFLSLPTSCTGQLTSTVLGDSWIEPLAPSAFPVLAQASMPALDSCNRLPFNPSIRVTPDGNAGSTPTGLNVDVHVPQQETLNASGLAEAAPKDITVALPPGVAVNPASGEGLTACSETLAGFTGFSELTPPLKTATFTERLPDPLQQGSNFCPDASKIATVKVKTPILPNPIEGAVYLASQNENPFGSLIALYLIAEDRVSGVVVKLAGETQLTETGQIITTFKNSPQAPFEDAELHFFGGERAPLATPARCGPYTTTALLEPWSGNPPASASSTFNITSGPAGSPCPGATLPFSPTLSAGTSNINAGSFTPLSTTIGRGDGQQDIQSVRLHMPAGLEGVLAGVTLCSEADANAGSCPQGSLIGETTVSAGVGADPVSVTGGKVYLTEKYQGAPFGLSIVNPVKAGPFDLEHDTANPTNQPACDCLVVRARIEVDPLTAELTVTTDPSGPHAIPRMIDGVPVQIRRVNVTINRERFTFNPTSCNPQSISGSIAGYEGASQPLSVPFQPTNCLALKFAPDFKVSTAGKTSKASGASLKVKLTYPKAPLGTYANVAKVKVSLPKQLPSRLTTLQKACTAAAFNANPASCPKESIVGQAKVITPLLPVPLTGPAYFVSHGGEAFPDLTIVLQGYGITVQLVGSTQIKNGITTSTFKATPDVPFDSFELTLPQGKFSALAANANLCNSKLLMPTEFTAQNGAVLRQATRIAVSGCAKAKLTRKQRLAKALKACRKRHGSKRASCERAARRRLGGKGRGGTR